MSDTVEEFDETVQTASIYAAPSHDATPSTTTSRRQHVHILERIPSEAGSISTGIVDPIRMVKPRPRRTAFPPLPDLRFQESYLTSLKGAKSWGRIAWITVRDQVSYSYALNCMMSPFYFTGERAMAREQDRLFDAILCFSQKIF
jgi:hypothetical protein